MHAAAAEGTSHCKQSGLQTCIALLLDFINTSVAFCLFSLYTEDPYPGSSIDLKCKEKVTDSDSENGSGDEGERKVAHRFSIVAPHLQNSCRAYSLKWCLDVIRCKQFVIIVLVFFWYIMMQLNNAMCYKYIYLFSTFSALCSFGSHRESSPLWSARQRQGPVMGGAYLSPPTLPPDTPQTPPSRGSVW